MTDPYDQGYAAYPVEAAHAWEYVGLSTRDYFAGQALAGAMVNAQSLGTLDDDVLKECLKRTSEIIYKVADAMIEARK